MFCKQGGINFAFNDTIFNKKTSKSFNQALGGCFKPYKAFSNLKTKFGCVVMKVILYTYFISFYTYFCHFSDALVVDFINFYRFGVKEQFLDKSLWRVIWMMTMPVVEWIGRSLVKLVNFLEIAFSWSFKK